MMYNRDSHTGKLTLTAAYSVTVLGVTVTREAGYSWYAGKWPARVRNPSPPMRIASFVHDVLYEDFPWTWRELTIADTLFAVVYLREGGKPTVAMLVWPFLRVWSCWTVLFREKSKESLFVTRPKE